MKLKINGKVYNVKRLEDEHIELVESVRGTLSESSAEILDNEKKYTRCYTFISQYVSGYVDDDCDIENIISGVGDIIDSDNGSSYSIAHKFEIVDGALIAHMLYMEYDNIECEQYSYEEIYDNWRNLFYKRFIVNISGLEFKYEEYVDGGIISFKRCKEAFKKKYIEYIKASLTDEDNRDRYNHEAYETATRYDEYVESYRENGDLEEVKEYEKCARLHWMRRMPSNINPVIKAFAE